MNYVADRLPGIASLAAMLVFLVPGPLAPSQVDGDHFPTEVEWAATESNWSRYVTTRDRVEYRLWDTTPIDYLGDEVAWEIDWAKSGKWAEAVGQAMYYAIVTDRKPGIVLLVKHGEEEQSRPYVYRCQTVCAKYGITLRIEEVKKREVPLP